MSVDVLVSLLKVVVLPDVVQGISANDDGPLHLTFHDNTSEDAATAAHIACEGAFLVDVGAINGLFGGLESKPNVLVVALSL